MDVEWLILADSAEVVGNKLYMLGGGWDTIAVTSQFPVQRPLALVASFVVPWNETNQKHAIDIQIQTEDGQVLVSINGQAEVGRPPGVRLGSPQRLQIAQNVLFMVEQPGTYVLRALIEGQEMKRMPFNVVAAPGVAVPAAR